MPLFYPFEFFSYLYTNILFFFDFLHTNIGKNFIFSTFFILRIENKNKIFKLIFAPKIWLKKNFDENFFFQKFQKIKI